MLDPRRVAGFYATSVAAVNGLPTETRRT